MTELPRYQNFINGQPMANASGETFPVVNPASYTIGSTGTAYTMFGPQPFRSWFTIDEKGNYWGVAPGDTVTIYAKWRDKVECTEIVLE